MVERSDAHVADLPVLPAVFPHLRVEAKSRRIRILRIVTRLNTGGPAVYLTTLCRGLSASRYEQWLVAGREGPGEDSMRAFAESRAIHPILLPEMVGTPRLGFSDAMAVARMRQLIHRLQPDIIETHLSKAGVIGRLAACLERSPIVVHVYHGHVLAGYYGAAKTLIARRVERALARVSDHLIAVSPRVRGDLVKYGVARPDQISVVEPGLDLESLLGCRGARGSLRRELDLDPSVRLVGIVGRLSRIKNHRLFLDAAARIAAARGDVRFLVVGDGELGAEIRDRARQMNLSHRMIFTGWRYDLPRIYADLDALALCSDNEGMPISLIEAMAAGCPVVATNVGGVPDLIDDGRTGLLVPAGAPSQMAAALLCLLDDDRMAGALASSAQQHVRTRFGAARFASDMDALYERLLRERTPSRSASTLVFTGPRFARRTSVPLAMDAERRASG